MPDNIYIYRESIIHSWLRDAGSFFCIVVSYWFNDAFLDSNNWLDALLFLFAIVVIIQLSLRQAKRCPHFTKIDDAIQYLETLKTAED